VMTGLLKAIPAKSISTKRILQAFPSLPFLTRGSVRPSDHLRVY
jgi:hypothetical protein